MVSEHFILAFIGAITFGVFSYFIGSRANWLTRKELTKAFGSGMACLCFLFLFATLSIPGEQIHKNSVSSLSEIVACEKNHNGAEICGIDKYGNKVKFCRNIAKNSSDCN